MPIKAKLKIKETKRIKKGRKEENKREIAVCVHQCPPGVLSFNTRLFVPHVPHHVQTLLFPIIFVSLVSRTSDDPIENSGRHSGLVDKSRWRFIGPMDGIENANADYLCPTCFRTLLALYFEPISHTLFSTLLPSLSLSLFSSSPLPFYLKFRFISVLLHFYFAIFFANTYLSTANSTTFTLTLLSNTIFPLFFFLVFSFLSGFLSL